MNLGSVVETISGQAGRSVRRRLGENMEFHVRDAILGLGVLVLDRRKRSGSPGSRVPGNGTKHPIQSETQRQKNAHDGVLSFFLRSSLSYAWCLDNTESGHCRSSLQWDALNVLEVLFMLYKH